jgi:hypothetical protein
MFKAEATTRKGEVISRIAETRIAAIKALVTAFNKAENI